MEVETSVGLARAHLHPAEEPRAGLVLGHGAGGSVGAPDLVAATEVAVSAGVSVALIEQPYRVAGKKSQPAASRIDAAWTEAIAELTRETIAGLPLIVGGRSAGARVACRTANEVGAIAVLCLAFPLLLPQRAGAKPPQSRLPELEAPDVPVLVVQGESDRFGVPPDGRGREVVRIRGDHGLKSDREALKEAVARWLGAVTG